MLDCSRVALIVALGLTVAACGGGGSSAPATTIPAPPPPPPPEPDTNTPDPDTVASFQTAEYNRTWALDAIGAADAYALGYTGEDTIIAVIDFNFDLNTTELNLHAGSRGRDPDNVAIYEAQIGEPASTTPHGHAVAVTAAGLKNDIGMHGVAFDASVLAVDFFSGVNNEDVVQDGILYHVSDPWTYAFNLGARIFNKSLGYDEDDIIQNPPIVSERYTVAFDTTVVELGGLLVSSAGNNSDPEPSLSNLDALDRLTQAGLLNNGPGAFIIAGSVDEDLTLSSFSDAAGPGESRFHYLVAPGGQVTFPWTDGLAVGNGTSFAAPNISGAAAVILSRWPSLSAREVADIMFETATDLGAPGVDSVYGQGLLNLSAAMQPSGEAKLALPQGKAQALTDTAIHLPTAFGDANGLMHALESVMILDGFNRDFAVDATSLVSSDQGRSNLEARFDARRNWQSAALRTSSNSHLNYSINQDRYSIPAFALAGQAAEDFQPEIDAVFELTGTYKEQQWYIGSGRSLSSAFAREAYSDAVAGGFSLTGANETAIPTGSGMYFALNRSLSPETDLWIGVSQSDNEGHSFHPVEGLQDDASVTSFAARLDHYLDTTRVSLEFGVAREKGSLLGGRAAGGFAFNDIATTSWLTSAAGWQLGSETTLEAKATLSVTETAQATASLLGDIGMITSSAFQVRLAKTGAFLKEDTLSLTLHQPLRVENANANLAVGAGLDRDTGEALFTTEQVSLAPAGREITLEAGYRTLFKGWQIEANAAFRRDAGHFAGQQDALFAFNIAKAF